MKSKILILALLICSATISAQNYKIGYVNVEKIFSEWPKLKAANTQLQEYEKQLQKQLQAKVKDFQTKVAAHNNSINSITPAQRKEAEEGLQNLQTDIQQFEANSQQKVAEKNTELLTPLQLELKKAIDAVGNEDGFTHILGQNSALIFTTDKSGDISSKVAQKLGFALSK